MMYVSTRGSAPQVSIGDAIRNAGMRFGMALDLWHKGDLHADDGDEPKQDEPGKARKSRGGMSDASFAKITQLIEATRTNPSVILEHFKIADLRELSKAQFDEAIEKLETDLARMAKAETNAKAQQPEGFGEILDDEIAY